MTLNEFLKELAKTPRDWQKQGPSKMIRGGQQDLEDRAMDCPLRAVFGGGYRVEALDAGMSEYNIRQVINAADNFGAPKLRARMLPACGLEGEATER